MKLLITGAGGFIGSRLADHFRAAGAQVGVDRQPGAHRAPLTVASLTELAGEGAPDVVLHAAGSGTVGQVASAPDTELPANLAALLAVLEFARAQAVPPRVVLLSSAALYGDAPAVPQRECDAREPASLYGLAKQQAEVLAAFYAHRHGVQTTAVRLFSVYGTGLRKQLLWDAMNKFAQGRSEFFGTGQEQRDWVHIQDVCRFFERLLARPAAKPLEVFNCAAGRSATTAEVLQELARHAQGPAPHFNDLVRAGDPACLVADCSVAQQLLGWRAQVPWQQGVAEYARWFQTQGAVRWVR